MDDSEKLVNVYSFPQISDKKWEKATKEISKHSQNIANDKIYFRDSIGVSYKDSSILDTSVKRVQVNKCVLKNFDFIRVAGTGSIFRDSKFENCSFIDCNFQYANFNKSEFDNKGYVKKQIEHNIEGSNFVGCNFNFSILKNQSIVSSTFSNANFSFAKIIDCQIKSCTFESTIFKNTFIQNIDLGTINIEYADFENVEFDNVLFPIMQIPYTFGGLEYLFEKDGLWLKSNDINNIQKRLNRKEYKKLLPSLEVYFIKMNEFFPLANIYLNLKEYDKFKQALHQGIKIAVLEKKFREIKFLCKLAARSNKFTHNQLKSILNLIKQLAYSNPNDTQAMHDYSLHSGEIQMILYSEIKKETVEIGFTIDRENNSMSLECLNYLLKEIDYNINELTGGKQWYRLQVSRNSPFDVLISYLPENYVVASLIIYVSSYLLKQSVGLIKDIMEIKNEYSKSKKEKIKKKLTKSKQSITNLKVNIYNINIYSANNILNDTNQIKILKN